MGDTDLSLLFKLTGDNTSGGSSPCGNAAAVASLKQTLGPELNQMLALTNKALASLGASLTARISKATTLFLLGFADTLELKQTDAAPTITTTLIM